MSDPQQPPCRWHLLTVRHRSEKKVALALSNKGFEVFLPTFHVKRQWSDRVKENEVPLFPCYLFCRCRWSDLLSVVSTPGVLSGCGTDPHPVPVSDYDMARIRKVLTSGFPVEPLADPAAGRETTGQIVCIDEGRLSGISGVLMEEPDRCRLVVKLDPTPHSVAVEIPRAQMCL
jgi:transcription antitermination factor NusG